MRSPHLALLIFILFFCPSPSPATTPASVIINESTSALSIIWRGDETIQVSISGENGVFNSPIQVQVGDCHFAINGFYVHLDEIESGYEVETTSCARVEGKVHVSHTLHHPDLIQPVKIQFLLWMEPQGRDLRVEASIEGGGAHLDRLGIGDHQGEKLQAERMFFGRMYVLDRPQAFETEHNYNTCKFWCWTMANGITELQATGGPAKGFRFDPTKGRYDLYTYCESPITYQFFFTAHSPQEAIAEYRRTIEVSAPPTLTQLPGRVGVMTAYPIAERYEDFLEEWTGKGARDFVWLSYCPTPGDRQKVERYNALYAVYDIYLDAFKEGPRKMEGWSPEMAQFRQTGKMVRGYWGSSWLLPDLYVKMATSRVMGVLGREFRNDQGENDFMATPATRYSNLAVTKAEVGPSGLYLDVHASKAAHHFFDYQAGHHGAREHMRGEKALFDFARDYLGDVPIWSEGGCEDYVGLMDGSWFMDWRPPGELGIEAAKWQYYPFIDQVHREHLLNMGIYYPLDHYDPDMVNAAILFGRPQAVSVYSGTVQDDVTGRLKVYYMTKAFHKMLGLSRMERIEFEEDDIDRCVVSYSNGAKVWSNRGSETWEVEGYRLPQYGYLIGGPGDFLEYSAEKDGSRVDLVRSPEYDYFASDQRTDFGAVAVDGALAIPRGGPNTVLIYEIQKPKGTIALKLGAVPGTKGGQRAVKANALLARGRRIELPFPDFRQPVSPDSPGRLGDIVEIRPVEMNQTLGYEIALEGPH